MISNRVDAILCDLDDTLLDHSRAAESAFRLWAADQNIEPNGSHWRHWRDAERAIPPEPHLGVSMSLTRTRRMTRFLRSVASDQAVPTTDEQLEMYDRYLAYYEELWQLYSDVVESLSRLRRRFPIGILTNGASAMQHKKIERTGAGTVVDFIIVSEDIGFAKPAPEAFLITEEHLRQPDQVLRDWRMLTVRAHIAVQVVPAGGEVHGLVGEDVRRTEVPEALKERPQHGPDQSRPLHPPDPRRRSPHPRSPGTGRARRVRSTRIPSPSPGASSTWQTAASPFPTPLRTRRRRPSGSSPTRPSGSSPTSTRESARSSAGDPPAASSRCTR
ncbi:hypothetical protein C5C34_08430 [Rathayibacter rathayi]|nr:hypothetical protein C5C34_08430 [Rathayibacter rathayi]PPG94503.1 hypothetical protein C5C22_08465 [Rathayibacter rathayi]